MSDHETQSFKDSNRKKVGIMGGTFNPIHNGHLKLAECALETFELDEILFIPSGISWLKAGQDIPDSRIRCEMTSLAIEEHPHFTLSTIEADREGNSYSFETVLTLKKLNPLHDYYFIMGADSLVSLQKWYHPEILLKECVILAAVREDVDKRSLEEHIRHLQKNFVCDIRLLSMPRFDLSSTMLREKAANGESIREFVPQKVADYIETNQLYRAANQ